MKNITSPWARSVALLAIVALTATCGLPRVGPNKREIFAGSVQKKGDVFVVTVNNRVTRATAVTSSLGFSSALMNAATVGSDTIRPGDTLGIQIYENSDTPILGIAAGGPSALPEIQVDGSGHIFVPYAGRVKASGRSPEGLRKVITSKLDEQTPDPQVLITRLAGDGGTVSIAGSAGAQGVYPIERPTRTLSAMLSKAGGVTIRPEVAQITLIRGQHQGKIWLEDLYKNPKLDVALRPGDRILVQEDTRTFTALGATGGQSRVKFDTPSLSAIEAIATVGGLNSALADPTGVFILRNEPAEVANAVLGRSDLIGDQRMAYVLDLTSPTGMFTARDFAIRNQDTVYVTEAPFIQWTKTISALTGSLASVTSVSSLASGSN
ncbi:MAG: polysaccharide biosynthesis/export family protein [Halocynthiibacter sp.]